MCQKITSIFHLISDPERFRAEPEPGEVMEKETQKINLNRCNTKKRATKSKEDEILSQSDHGTKMEEDSCKKSSFLKGKKESQKKMKKN